MAALVRKKVDAPFFNSNCINPSLLLEKGLLSLDGENSKKEHLQKLVALPASAEYKTAFNRWFDLTGDDSRFQQAAFTVKNRLLIGMNGNAGLETGCCLSRNYGMPYIPGSSVKGVVRNWANSNLNAFSDDIEELLGTDDSEQPSRISGTVTFHDAWWIPKDGGKPFVLDVVTTHHQAYYNGSQDEPSDTDSPIPNHLLAVQGSFLFVLEGEPEAVQTCQRMLEEALKHGGIGAKTAAGYGYMRPNLLLASNLQRESDQRLPAEVKEKRKAEAQRKFEQQKQDEAKAELEKSPSDIVNELSLHYKTQRDSQDYQKKIEAWIDSAIENWQLEDRHLLASCLEGAGYIPSKKKKNHPIRKARLNQLKGVK
ncbi:type III-B CRISPR module RAMP protein Cmr6 [Salinivibrio sp. MA351]|uniref:type III-B CRISPR module RAMP protein Cmr6 n=1 Tax=Salinivibrio sp. MA351 TaxID=1909453 RepID=UPI0009897389|nr:type III-B CRISPR module RAMP protein Cmr6 [Salinivibrio sp. MA351]OOE99702.1 type III-B CRISPR module RAMP protein Cmr6 [Salinivibrio sp. MA351]